MSKNNINLHKKTFSSLTSKEENFIFENFDEVAESLRVGRDIYSLKKYKDIKNKQEKKYFFREFMQKKEAENCHIFLLYKTNLFKLQKLIGFAIVCNKLLSYLVINKKFRKQKYGTYLIKELQKIYPELEAKIEINNPKLKEFYKKNDFKENGFYIHPFTKDEFLVLKWRK